MLPSSYYYYTQFKIFVDVLKMIYEINLIEIGK